MRAIISGRVQGVGYRAYCSRTAVGLGVDGTVRNRPDGTVEVVAEGDPDAVDALLDWCRGGPRYARVRSVESTSEEPVGETGFRIVG